MADIPAGSLTVKVDASIKPLEDGLNKAKQKVAQADKAIQQTTENTKRGFFEAGGKVKDFQSKLSESLGVIAGFAAAAPCRCFFGFSLGRDLPHLSFGVGQQNDVRLGCFGGGRAHGQ